jgi:cyclopropane-fatty-acyl-phospholipid synthase
MEYMLMQHIKAVGVKYLPQFFRILDWALKLERVAVITSVTQPESHLSLYQ